MRDLQLELVARAQLPCHRPQLETEPAARRDPVEGTRDQRLVAGHRIHISQRDDDLRFGTGQRGGDVYNVILGSLGPVCAR
ncbi:hypothetical protein GCM10018954_037250 [Kutzneria kofuensis]